MSNIVTCTTLHTGVCSFKVIPPKGMTYLNVEWLNEGFHYRIEYAPYDPRNPGQALVYRKAHEGWLTDNQ